MTHSDPLEAHANLKLDKIMDMLKEGEEPTPLYLEVWLKAHKKHPHHGAELHLKTPRFDLHAHDEGTDIYVVLDNAIDKMIELFKKAKRKALDKEHKEGNEKAQFAADQDKYTLSDSE